MGEIVKIMLLKLCNNISFYGGEGGIRTPGTHDVQQISSLSP